VGSRLLPRLVEAGVECRALVRPGKKLPAGVIPIKGDILDPASLAEAVEGVDAIIHLAAVLRTPEAEQIWAVNCEGTRNLIKAARAYAPHARFIMASTGLVYNLDSPRPAREDDAVDPQRDYPASKAAAESLLRDSGLNWSILRFGFVYGDKDQHLESIPTLAKMFKWHPANKLSMIHHRDIAELVKLGLTGVLDGRVVNAVDEAPMSIYEIAELIGAPVTPSSEPLEHPWWGQLDGSLARELGFRSMVATTWQAAREGML